MKLLFLEGWVIRYCIALLLSIFAANVLAEPQKAGVRPVAAVTKAKPAPKAVAKSAAKPAPRSAARQGKGVRYVKRAGPPPPEPFNPDVLDVQSSAALVVNLQSGD